MHHIPLRASLMRALAPAVLLAACTQAPLASGPAGQPSSATRPLPSALPAAQHGRLGHNGSIAWLTTSQGLSLSTDAGHTFASVPLPASVSPTAIEAVDAVPGTMWLASRGPGRSVSVYARDNTAGRWSAGAKLTPTWPTDLGGAETQPPSSVWIIPGASNEVLVMTQLGISHSVSIPRPFVSDDGGLTFAQRVLPTPSDYNSPWDAIAVSGAAAVAVIGERFDLVIHSNDSGSTWAATSVNGVMSGADFVVGTPVFAGSTVYLPLTESQADGKAAFVLLRSTDGGASFGVLGAQTLALGMLAADGAPPLASAGGSWWLVSPMDGFVYRSADNGRTWSKAATALPQGVVDIAATDGQNATITVVENTCASGKSDCSSSQYSETTSDGGLTWTRF